MVVVRGSPTTIFFAPLSSGVSVGWPYPKPHLFFLSMRTGGSHARSMMNMSCADNLRLRMLAFFSPSPRLRIRASRVIRKLEARKKRSVKTGEWNERIALTLACADNNAIPRVPDAGKKCGNDIVMHNGLRVATGSYYSTEYDRMLLANKGVHEPQEEHAFQEMLLKLPPSPVMLELGAHWGFYSLWFKQVHQHGRCLLVEPDMRALNMGRLNFLLNKMEGEFICGAVGARPKHLSGRKPMWSVDALMECYEIDRLHVLHADIQRSESKMLEGCQKAFDRKAVDWIFISTHTEELHRQCIVQLQNTGFRIDVSVTPAQSYSVDGLIVAVRTELVGIPDIAIATKPLA